MTLPNRLNVIGIDECAIGTLVGSIFACAVLVPQGYGNPEVNDSKKIDKKKIPDIAKDIIKNCQVYACSASVSDIDRVGTWNTWDALISHIAWNARNKMGFSKKIYLDGNRKPPIHSLETIEKGDSKWFQIAAASIVAKYYQMKHMQEIHAEFPQYGFLLNCGYGSNAHYEALKIHGPCKFHRRAATKSFLSRPPRIT